MELVATIAKTVGVGGLVLGGWARGFMLVSSGAVREIPGVVQKFRRLGLYNACASLECLVVDGSISNLARMHHEYLKEKKRQSYDSRWSEVCLCVTGSDFVKG